MKSKIIISILFAWVGSIGLYGFFIEYSKEHQIQHQVQVDLNKPTQVLLQNGTLLSVESIESIQIQNQKVYINQDTLTFKKDTIQGIIYELPQNEVYWKNYLSSKLSHSKTGDFETVLLKIKETFNHEWGILSKLKSWKELTDIQKCCHLLVNSIEANQNELFFLNKSNIHRLPKSSIKKFNQNLQLTSLKTIDRENKGNLILSLTLVLIGILGLIFTNLKSKEVVKNELETTNESTIKEDNLTTHTHEFKPIITTENQEDLLLNYFQNFHERYGDFYTNIEQLPEYPTDETTKQKIKSQLVEMGLHAHSISRAFLFNYLHRPENEPNILLIQNEQLVSDLHPKRYKKLTFSAYETSKRYRFLAKILIEMNIGSLDGALMHDTYLPKDLLNQSE